ncbi:MAG: hypothetical protein AMXMBFR7_17370 [Planctomycetota bacterium]
MDAWEPVVIVAAEPKDVALPAAFNDPAGTWIVEATDVFALKRTVENPLHVK